MDKRFLAIIGVILVIFVGAFFLKSNNKDNQTSSNSTQPTSHVQGNTASKVTLLEYGDYECPACESFSTTVAAVNQKYASSVKFQFRNLPLTQIHPNALAGARAAEAADLQGKFWQMHDALYLSSNWSQWSTSSNPDPYFWQYAQQLGLNVNQFKTDFASDTVNNRISADRNAFAKTGQDQATPAFFLNGKFIDNSTLLDKTGQPSLDAFSKVIDAALATKK